MEKIKLEAEIRKIVGKKVKKLRSEGIIPANLFGKDIKSTSLQVTGDKFRKIFRKAGETSVVEIAFDKKIEPALIHKVQKDPVTDKIIHIDFHKVNLKEKITAHVPLVLIGESPAEKNGTGLILQTINELEIESLPGDIPHQIEVDISKLGEIGETVHIKDLKIDREKVEVKNESEDVVVTVQNAEMKEEPIEEEVPGPEEVEATAEKEKEETEKSKEDTKEEPSPEKENS